MTSEDIDEVETLEHRFERVLCKVLTLTKSEWPFKIGVLNEIRRLVEQELEDFRYE